MSIVQASASTSSVRASMPPSRACQVELFLAHSLLNHLHVFCEDWWRCHGWVVDVGSAVDSGALLRRTAASEVVHHLGIQLFRRLLLASASPASGTTGAVVAPADPAPFASRSRSPASLAAPVCASRAARAAPAARPVPINALARGLFVVKLPACRRERARALVARLRDALGQRAAWHDGCVKRIASVGGAGAASRGMRAGR